ncbi:hypothetical protein BM28_A0509 [Brucella melitensis M28]|nr:hypothetical protein BM28_A0509 [Brucella melitensis M28]
MIATYAVPALHMDHVVTMTSRSLSLPYWARKGRKAGLSL